jgi:hypothetical protein
VTLFSLKFNIFFTLKNLPFLTCTGNQDPDPHSPKKLDTDPHKVNPDPKHWPEHQIGLIYERQHFLQFSDRPITSCDYISSSHL